MPALRDATVAMPDGRRLAYTEWGVPEGKPVMYFHGMPASRLWCPDEEATAEARVRLIAPDRPGIGRSDPLEGRTLADWPKDVEALADALDISTFGLVGVSAGGPYAAACAALIPGRLEGVALVASRALTEYNWAERPEAIEELGSDERAVFELARHDPAAAANLAAEQFAKDVDPLEDYPDRIRKYLEAAEGDRWFFEDASRAAIFDAYTREAWHQGFDAMRWEFIDVFQPWGFRLADIGIPVTIWFGSQDPRIKFVDWQRRAIPNSTVVVWPDSGHLGFAKHWREILEAATIDA
jgi:pimeloyl-ACP methyl ester carboxylesterase